jgi:anti-sigma B factor antagonist
MSNATISSEVHDGALRLSSRSVGSTCTIALTGELDLANVDAFQEMLREALLTRPTAIIVDLEALEFIDSSGIACLVYTQRELEEAGGCLRMVASRAPGVCRVMEATGLDTRLAFIPNQMPA